MSTALDVLDILDIDEGAPKRTIIDKDALLARTEKKKSKNQNAPPKRPENMPREVWGLHSTLNNELPPLMPTDESLKYKQPKAVIGVGRVRKWLWTGFTNSARKDGLILYHWRREKPDSDSDEDYYFARYNKHANIPEYTQAEYESLLQDPKWSPEKTAHLMELAKRFDLRFIHIRDRWDSEKFPPRPSIEDLKERYYFILMQLDKAHGTNLSQGLRYDAAHERRRKQQLSLLYGRTKDQVEEEQTLVQELRKIEARRRERERKKQDLQKLILQADSLIRDQDITDGPGGVFDSVFDGNSNSIQSTSGSFSVGHGSSTGGGQRKRTGGGGAGGAATNSNAAGLSSGLSYAHGAGDSSSNASAVGAPTTGGSGADVSASLNAAFALANSALGAAPYVIGFPDPSKNPGVHLRSQKMKLPGSLGQRKIRIIENFLAHLQIDPTPPATAEIVEAYNNLRTKILLLYDLRMAQLHCDFELQAARLRLEAFAPDQPLPAGLANVTHPTSADSNTNAVDIKFRPGSGFMTPGSAQIDPIILAALRDADSKRPIVPRHSLGVAGTLAAAAGSSGLGLNLIPMPDIKPPATRGSGLHGSITTTTTTTTAPTTTSTTTSTGRLSLANPSSQTVLRSSASSSSSTAATASNRGTAENSRDPAGDGILQRRRRAAALEQGRVLKKLRIKGQLVD
ncbi:unnamed protein product [Calicophoron daubneyi]|uniref:DNA methyltransferase 1-associated protein 1 n=1 Tax=Calicophoron daubneyi TaxID=300641 RepID=A0AAV2TQV2_CALDB